MPRTFQKATADIHEMANTVLCRHESHKPLLDHRVKVDILMAFPAVNRDGEYTGDALTVGGYPAQACIRILGLKDRTAGLGDAQMLIDATWWAQATGKEKEALLDHELHHLSVIMNRSGGAVRDDLNRPKLKMRKHDLSVGWFAIVAARNGEHSAERIQAGKLFRLYQAEFWPDLVKAQAEA